MKKGMLLTVFLGIFLFSLVGVSAMACKITPTLINQDPYLATPGDYVKLVFQLDGLANPECGKVEFELKEQYPLIFDPNTDAKVIVSSGIYAKDFSSYLIVPYKVRIDEDALDGDNPIEVQFKYGSGVDYETKQFNLNVDGAKADFKIHVKHYSYITKILTLEILYLGESNIQALRLEIPKQANIEVKNSNVNNIGDLDVNDYTTADFEAIPKEGEITVKINYVDSANIPRTVEKSVSFDPTYFQGRVEDQTKNGTSNYIIIAIILLVVAFVVYRRIKKKKAKRHAMHR